MCLMLMKHIIPITIKGFMPDKISAQSFRTEVAGWFIKSEKVETSTFSEL